MEGKGAPERGFNRMTQALTVFPRTNPAALETGLISGNTRMSLGTAVRGWTGEEAQCVSPWLRMG